MITGLPDQGEAWGQRPGEVGIMVVPGADGQFPIPGDGPFVLQVHVNVVPCLLRSERIRGIRDVHRRASRRKGDAVAPHAAVDPLFDMIKVLPYIAGTHPYRVVVDSVIDATGLGAQALLG